MRHFLLWLSCGVLALLGCGRGTVPEPALRRLSTKGHPVEFTFPSDWRQRTDEHPFDLQVLSGNGQASTGVFVWDRRDLASDITPHKLLDLQVQDMRSKRRNFVLQVEESTVRTARLALTSVLYAGEKGEARHLYRFVLVEFDNDPDKVVVLLQVVKPSQWQNLEPILDEIARSARVKR